MARLGSIWGLGGILAILAYAVFSPARPLNRSLRLRLGLGATGTLLILNTAFMAHSEGYMGFPEILCPTRGRPCPGAPRPARPCCACCWLRCFCMGYFHATRRRLLSIYTLTLGIIVLIVIFQYISQPWRGILDGGVVVGPDLGHDQHRGFGGQGVAGAVHSCVGRPARLVHCLGQPLRSTALLPPSCQFRRSC